MKALAKFFAVILVLSLIVAGAGFALAGFDFNAFAKAAKIVTDADFELKEEIVTGDVNEIVIDTRNDNITLLNSPDENFYISYYVSEEYKQTEFSSDNGKIYLKSQYNTFNLIFSFSIVTDKSNEVTVKIPVAYADKIDFKTSNGKITTEVPNNFSAFDVTTTNGKINIKNITVLNGISLSTSNSNVSIENVTSGGKLYAKTTNGSISVDNANCRNDMTLSTSNSAVTLTNVGVQGSTSVTTTNGKLRISGSTFNSAELKSSNDAVTINNSAFSSVTATTTNGKISIDGITSDSIDLKTSNGQIDVKITGSFANYKIDVKTSNDTIKVNEQTQSNGIINPAAAKFLKAHTTNGKIVVNFQ